jgi:hypothetical protein
VSTETFALGDKQMRDMQEQPAGWYRDTERPNLHRYWTGERWGERVAEELAVLDHARVPRQKRRDLDLDQRNCG